MKRHLFLKLIPAAPFGLRAAALEPQNPERKKMLIVYYSWSRNTRHVAETIKKLANADIVEIIPTKPYPTSYNKVVAQAKIEADTKYKPEINTKIPNLNEYDIILIGSPNWWGTISSPIRTFLSQNKFDGKALYPFMTHEGSRMGSAETEIKTLCPSAKIFHGLPIRGGSVKSADKEVENWLKQNRLIS